jgi:hypothetical protein
MLVTLLVVLALVVSFAVASLLGHLLHKQTVYTCLLCEQGEFEDALSLCAACKAELSEGREHTCFHCQQDSDECLCE